MEKITQIDLLVHPFFAYSEKGWLLGRYSEEEAKSRMELWKNRVDEIKRDGKRILVYLSKTLYKEEFFAIKKIRTEKIPAFLSAYVPSEMTQKEEELKKRQVREATLVKYAYEKLGENLFFFEDNPLFFFRGNQEDEELEKIGRLIDPKNTFVWVYGEWISDCCIDASTFMSNRLGIPRANFKFLPKLSGDAPKRYLSREEIECIKKLPKKERDKIIRFIRERLKEYTNRIKKFKEEVILVL